MKKSLNETGPTGRSSLTGAKTAVNNLSADEWVLPAIPGVQARREYSVVLVKLRELPGSSRPSTRRCHPSSPP